MPVHPLRHAQHALRSPRFKPYNRLIVAVLGLNALLVLHGATVGGWWTSGRGAATLTVTAAQANLLVGTLSRQPWLINAVGWVATRPSPRWPLRLRWALGKYYQVGGLHVGAALSGTLWYLLFVATLLRDHFGDSRDVAPETLGTALLVVCLLVAMAVLALPRFRATAHDRFEISHRFFAWAALALVWANTVAFVAANSDDGLVPALAASPTAWMLTATTACAVWPWLLLRRVPVTVERPSSHAAIVRLHRGTPPPIGTTRAISRSPFVGWHHFANVPAAPGESGYRMLVSRAGDWTGEFIDDPPTHVWVRSLPAVGVANVKRLFDRVIYVVTGSGIGPALGHLLTDGQTARLVWVTRTPRTTYGDALIDEVERAQPEATVWNTDVRGKPDVLELADGVLREFDAQAVICISNRTVTRRVVHGFEQRGIPAFGPIWDS